MEIAILAGRVAEFIGYLAILIGWAVISLGILLALWWAIGQVGKDLFKRLRRVFHLTVIGYQLDHLERLGVRKYMKANGTYGDE